MDIFKVIQVGSLQAIEAAVQSTSLTTHDTWLDYEVLNASLECGRCDVAKYLLDINCRVNEHLISRKPKNTPLHNAVNLQNAQLVAVLLRKGASLNAVNVEGDTALHLAFAHKNEEIIDLILDEIQRTSDHTDVKNNQNLGHLHIACTRNNGAVIKNYLDNGASASDMVYDTSTWAGYDAMRFALDFESSIATRILQESRTPPKPVSDEFVKSTVKLAEEGKIMDDFYNELCYGNAWDFHAACLVRNNVDTIRKFINCRINLNVHIHCEHSDFAGYTALHFAVMSGSIENVKLLLGRKAAVDRSNCAQMTPLHMALYIEDANEKSEIVDILYKALRDKTQLLQDENMVSLLHVAVTRNKVSKVRAFLDDGENVNRRVMKKTPKFPGYAPIHFAVRYGLKSMTLCLIRKGANVNLRSEHGTPLDIAYEIGHEDLIRMLKANRVDA